MTDDNNKKKKQNKADKTAKYIYSNCTRTGSHSEFSTNFLIDASRNETETEKCTDAEHSTFQKISMQSMIIDNEWKKNYMWIYKTNTDRQTERRPNVIR